MSITDKETPGGQAVENGNVAVQGGKRHKIKRHFKRFWWIHFIIFLCLVVLGVCLTIFVGVPDIAQDKINDAKLEIQGVNILQTESLKYRMEINSTITTSGGISAHVKGFKGVMYLEDLPAHTPFTNLDFPPTNANKHQMVNISQEVEITDLEAFDVFNIWFQNNKTLNVSVEGHTSVKPAGLETWFGVHFKKTVNINGLDLYKGTKVLNGSIGLENDIHGNNFNGTADIPNTSVFTLDIGNATFINFVGDEVLGSLTIPNLLLKPGSNVVNITAKMDQFAILDLVQSSKYCHTGILPFKLLGANVTNHGQNISYFAAALASANQTVDIDIGSIIKKDLNTTVDCQSS